MNKSEHAPSLPDPSRTPPRESTRSPRARALHTPPMPHPQLRTLGGSLCKHELGTQLDARTTCRRHQRLGTGICGMALRLGCRVQAAGSDEHHGGGRSQRRQNSEYDRHTTITHTIYSGGQLCSGIGRARVLTMQPQNGLVLYSTCKQWALYRPAPCDEHPAFESPGHQSPYTRDHLIRLEYAEHAEYAELPVRLNKICVCQ
jgi:hypothetical protein